MKELAKAQDVHKLLSTKTIGNLNTRGEEIE